ncbi:helix-turn-helix domain-containing protein [Clostridium sp. MCC353]|uniref:helix-turn-helix domain-containing protein n=1 Tax=Clostridium sp. MCC353 TaxID=2592646 RepID=UPI001C01AAA1|nr:helix-turn-helix domain-containing protein [Clostridium sp. MCC353]
MIRILVVDDEHPIREWLVHIIRSNRPEFLVDSAVNGLDALKKCKEIPFDLLIMDIRMPHMDGLEVLQALSKECPGAGAIMLSSYDDYNYVRDAFKHQAVDYLLKTEINDERLLAAIDHYCSQKTAARNLNHLVSKLRGMLQESDGSGQDFFKELKKYGNLEPQGAYFCFLVKARAEGSPFKPSLTLTEKTVLRFCLPVDENIFMGCVELLTQPSLLTLMQTQSMYLKKLNSYNRLSLLLYSDIQHDVRLLPDAMKNLYASRELDFYGVQFCRPELFENGMELRLNERYLEMIELLRSHKQEEVLSKAEELLNFAENVRYPDVDNLKLLCIKLCESAYLNSCSIDLMEYHNYFSRLSASVFSSESIRHLYEILIKSLSSLYSQKEQNQSVLSSRIAHAVSFVEAHYMDDISLVSVAKDLHINPEYLSRTFKQQVGINFSTYLNNVRLQHALELLKQTDYRVAEIAMRTGFQSPAYFSKCFKAAFGLSPQQWKAAKSGEN